MTGGNTKRTDGYRTGITADPPWLSVAGARQLISDESPDLPRRISCSRGEESLHLFAGCEGFESAGGLHGRESHDVTTAPIGRNDGVEGSATRSQIHRLNRPRQDIECTRKHIVRGVI